MNARPQPSVQRKPLFSRRFLWLLIFILIPLIPLLHSLGPSEAFLVDPPEGEVRTAFDVENLTVEQDRYAGLPVTWVHLPDSDQVRISVLSDRQPLEAAPAPSGTRLDVEARHGRFVATLMMPLTTAGLQDGTRFLNQWLPAQGEATRVVLTGNLTAERVKAIAERIAGADAPGVAVQISRPAAVTRFTSPPPGHADYLHFALAMNLLEQRLSGYNARLTWTHRGRDSEALLNTTLDAEQRRVPEREAFERLRTEWVEAHRGQQRDIDYVHRQLVTLTAHDAEPAHLIERADRLEELTYEAFSSAWRDWFGRP